MLLDEEEIARKQKLKEKEAWKGRSKKGRHNKYPGQTFATRKKLNDSNMNHSTVKGKFKEAKQFIDFKCHCLNQCGTKLQEEKEILFHKFYDLASYDLQTSYIAGAVKEMLIKRKTCQVNHSLGCIC